MNYRYDDEHEEYTSGQGDKPEDTSVPNYADHTGTPSYDTSDNDSLPGTEYQSRKTESDERADYEQQPPQNDWREASYYEVTKPQEPVFTPGLGSSQFYAPPRREPARRDSPDNEAPRRTRRGGRFARALCLVLVCAVISAGAGIGGAYYGLSSGLIAIPKPQVVLGATPPPEASPVADTSGNPAIVTGEKLTGPEIYRMATQQVVGVSTEVTTTGGNFNPFYSGGTSAVYGTGFIISADGYILTNYHVIETAYQYGVAPQIIMRDGTTYSARIIGFEPENDVAVLKIDATGLTPVKIGSSGSVVEGETIYAVGNPNQLDYTITDGIVSALNREVQVSTDSDYSIIMFQISAAVNSGNSGGPVYNEYGEVIGIVSAKYMSTGTEGLGFAIPIDDAMRISSDLITVGYVTGKAQLGITVQTMTEANAEYYGTVPGAFVFTVVRGSCAEAAGIKPGDIITKLGDAVVLSSDELKAALSNYKAGDTISAEIYRDNAYLTLSITFDEQNNSPSERNSQNVDVPSIG